MIRFSNGETVETKDVFVKDEKIAGFNRSTATIITTGIDYANAVRLFIDGAKWDIVEGDEVFTEWEEYTKAGPITDNRDGTLVVKMGKTNTSEQDAIAAKNKAEENATKVSSELVVLAGKPIGEGESVKQLREAFEAAANKLSDSDSTIAPSLNRAWALNEQIAQGERRYFATNGSVYKCLKTHTSSVSNMPDTATEFWSELW